MKNEERYGYLPLRARYLSFDHALAASAGNGK